MSTFKKVSKTASGVSGVVSLAGAAINVAAPSGVAGVLATVGIGSTTSLLAAAALPFIAPVSIGVGAVVAACKVYEMIKE